MEDNNNKQKKLTIIAVVTLLALVAGATYAYFSVGVTSNFGTSTINATADNIGTVTLNGSSANLNLHVTAVDMMKGENSINYYATPDGTSTDEAEKETVIGTASVSPTTDTNYYHCEYTLQVSQSYTGDKNMYNIFKGTQQVDSATYIASANELVLLVNGTSYDLNTNTLPKEITGSFGIKGTQTVNITAGLKLVSISDKNQNMLAGSGVNISIQVKPNSFTCTATEPPTAPGTILEGEPNITTELAGGLYRYQGTTVNNNYICFGTTDMTTCKNNPDTYMYRILGVKENNQLKLIKNTAINNVWDYGYSGPVSWENSYLFSILNGDSYLNNISFVPSNTWKERISNSYWKYGDVYEMTPVQGGYYNGDYIYAIENAWTDTVEAKIGLMYAHDYYYAYPNGNPENASNAMTSWIHISKTGTATNEWIIDRWNQSHSTSDPVPVWYINGESGSLETSHPRNLFAARPVFYLNSDVVISSGSGTSDSPYMIQE